MVVNGEKSVSKLVLFVVTPVWISQQACKEIKTSLISKLSNLCKLKIIQDKALREKTHKTRAGVQNGVAMASGTMGRAFGQGKETRRRK